MSAPVFTPYPPSKAETCSPVSPDQNRPRAPGPSALGFPPSENRNRPTPFLFPRFILLFSLVYELWPVQDNPNFSPYHSRRKTETSEGGIRTREWPRCSPLPSNKGHRDHRPQCSIPTVETGPVHRSFPVYFLRFPCFFLWASFL